MVDNIMMAVVVMGGLYFPARYIISMTWGI